jgi:hypothetical protein
MKTYSANSLAEHFEVDRRTMVRCLRSQPPDAEVTAGRPTWKISTVAKALEAHRRKMDGGGDGIDPTLARLYQRFDAADAAMRALPELEARRAAARFLAPLIAKIDAAMRAHGRAVGVDPELIDLRAGRVFLLTMRGFEGPCAWSLDECWEQLEVRGM